MQQLLMIDGNASEMQRDSPDAIVGHASGTKLLMPSYDPAGLSCSRSAPHKYVGQTRGQTRGHTTVKDVFHAEAVSSATTMLTACSLF